ncbi:hypothetical protein ACOYR1_12050 [Thalassotalea piscium]
MKTILGLLLIPVVLLVSTMASANNFNVKVNTKDDHKNLAEVWNNDFSQKAFFNEKNNTTYLTIYNQHNKLVAEHLIPRAKKLKNITWSANNKYLTFTENDRNLWVYTIEHNARLLIENKLINTQENNLSVQWSPNSEWIQYLSNENSRNKVKIYSLKRHRPFLLPIDSSQISSINWQGYDNELIINSLFMEPKKSEQMTIYGITLVLQADSQVALLH